MWLRAFPPAHTKVHDLTGIDINVGMNLTARQSGVATYDCSNRPTWMEQLPLWRNKGPNIDVKTAPLWFLFHNKTLKSLPFGGERDYNDLKFSFKCFPFHANVSCSFFFVWFGATVSWHKKKRQNPKCVQMLSSNLSDMNSMTLRVSFQHSSENLESPEKVKTGRITHHSPPSPSRALPPFSGFGLGGFDQVLAISHVSVMRMMGTRPVCEGTVSLSHNVLANPQTELAVGLMETFNSPFEQCVSCQVWLAAGFTHR